MKMISRCPECKHHLNPDTDEAKTYCPICNKEVFTLCPECQNEILLECTIGADESASGFVERLYSCAKCGSAWSSKEINDTETELQRYFFG